MLPFSFPAGTMGTMKMELRELDEDGFEDLLKIYRETSQWLMSKGYAMWNPIYIADRGAFIAKYLDPRCFGLYIDDDLAGGFIIKSREDFFWSDDADRNCWYVHKLVVDRNYSGMGLADIMLQWILAASVEERIESVRLECYADRKPLMELYERNGFELKEIETMDDGVHIALLFHDNTEVIDATE